MVNVVFVAPFFLDTTLRFVDAAAGLPGVRLGLVSQDPEEKLPKGLHSRLAGYYRVEDGRAVASPAAGAPSDAESVRLRRTHSRAPRAAPGAAGHAARRALGSRARRGRRPQLS